MPALKVHEKKKNTDNYNKPPPPTTTTTTTKRYKNSSYMLRPIFLRQNNLNLYHNNCNPGKSYWSHGALSGPIAETNFPKYTIVGIP